MAPPDLTYTLSDITKGNYLSFLLVTIMDSGCQPAILPTMAVTEQR